MNPFKRKPKTKLILKKNIDEIKKVETTYTFKDIEKEGEIKKEELTETISKSFEDKSEEIKSIEKQHEIISINEQSKANMIEEKAQPFNKEELNLVSDDKGIMRITDKNLTNNQNTQQIIFKDASSVIAEKLPAQLGSDPRILARGEYDVRRLTHINEIERVWLGYFDLLDPFEGGEWAHDFAYSYANWSMSIGGERAKLLVKMQMAASGGMSAFKKPEDKRNFIEKHFTKRGQEPKEDDMSEL